MAAKDDKLTVIGRINMETDITQILNYFYYLIVSLMGTKMGRDWWSSRKNGNGNGKSSSIEEIKDELKLIWKKFDLFRESNKQSFEELKYSTLSEINSVKNEVGKIEVKIDFFKETLDKHQTHCYDRTREISNKINFLEGKVK